MRHAIIDSKALLLGRKVLRAAPYVHPTCHIDKKIARTRRGIEQGKKRLETLLAEREQLIEENKQLRAEG